MAAAEFEEVGSVSTELSLEPSLEPSFCAVTFCKKCFGGDGNWSESPPVLLASEDESLFAGDCANGGLGFVTTEAYTVGLSAVAGSAVGFATDVNISKVGISSSDEVLSFSVLDASFCFSESIVLTLPIPYSSKSFSSSSYGSGKSMLSANLFLLIDSFCCAFVSASVSFPKPMLGAS